MKIDRKRARRKRTFKENEEGKKLKDHHVLQGGI